MTWTAQVGPGFGVGIDTLELSFSDSLYHLLSSFLKHISLQKSVLLLSDLQVLLVKIKPIKEPKSVI